MCPICGAPDTDHDECCPRHPYNVANVTCGDCGSATVVQRGQGRRVCPRCRWDAPLQPF